VTFIHDRGEMSRLGDGVFCYLNKTPRQCLGFATAEEIHYHYTHVS